MLDTLQNTILSGQLQATGYLLLYLAVLIEGPVATLLGATLAASGRLHVGYAFIAVMAGNMSADLGWYFAGHAGRFAALEQKLPGLHRFDDQINRLLCVVKKHPFKILASSKLYFGIAAIPALVAAGMAHISWRRLLPILFLCELIWSGVLFCLGYFLSNSLPVLYEGLEDVTLAAAGLLFISVVLASLWILYRKND